LYNIQKSIEAATLQGIATRFGINHVGSVSNVICDIKCWSGLWKWYKQIDPLTFRGQTEAAASSDPIKERAQVNMSVW